MAASVKDEEDGRSVCSESSTLVDGSVISTVPDRHGFLGGTQYSPEPRQGPPPEIVLRRERKWLKMLSKWTFYMNKNYAKVRERCRKGIPMSVRPRAWAYLCGGMILMETYKGRYQACLEKEVDARAMDDIRKDLHRQFPFHEMFCSEDKPGQKELANVLRAYVVNNPTVGYCQAQAPVAAFLLMHMPAEQAFWCLVSISDKYLMDYYSPSMEIVQRDGMILEALLKKVCASAYKHLKKVNAEPMYYCTEWFLCAYTRTLPWDSLLRIWDIFLCEGVKVLFKVALVILVGCLGDAKNRRRCAGLCETLDFLRNPPEEVLSEEYLVVGMAKLNLTQRDFAAEHQRQTLKMRSNVGR